MALRLCAVIRVHKTQRTDATHWEVVDGELYHPISEPHLHRDGEDRTHWEIPAGFMRVCVPLTMEQQTLDLKI